MKRWTVDEYHELIKLGVLTKDDPYELIEGWLVEKMPKGPPHESSITVLNKVLIKALPDNWVLRIQASFTLPDGEPEPDLAIVRGPESRYDDVHPTPADAAIVIEVASATLESNRTIKLRSYARAGVAEYWIVNLIDYQVEVYTQPRMAGELPEYGSRKDYQVGQDVPAVIEGTLITNIAVAEACRYKPPVR
jgi:Uma2 family endonuclease